jgi:hypothetical protein
LKRAFNNVFSLPKMLGTCLSPESTKYDRPLLNQLGLNNKRENVPLSSSDHLSSDHGNSSEKVVKSSPPSKKAKIPVSSGMQSCKEPTRSTYVSDDGHMQELINKVTLVVANVIRFGNSWTLDDTQLQHITNPSANHVCTNVSHHHQRGILLSNFAQGNSRHDDNIFKSSIAQAVQHFAAEVWVPHLLSSKSRMGCISPRTDRVIISTLLAIQEMLHETTIKHFPSLQEVHEWVGATIHASIKCLSSASNISLDMYWEALEGYNLKRSDFKIALMEADGRSVGVQPDGTKVSQVENAVHKASFNYARTSHPLVGNTKNCNDSTSHRATVNDLSSLPSPNACATLLVKSHSTASSDKGKSPK